MHEFALAESTLNVVLAAMEKQGATQLHSVKLRVGTLTGVVADSMIFAFETLSEGTKAAGGKLEIEEVPLACFCPVCNHEFAARALSYRCPTCGTASTEVRRGRELDLVSIEVS